jgi:hypothetical protein
MSRRTTLLLLTLIAIVLVTATPALAACVYNGRPYPTGTRVGPYVCAASGAWIFSPR